MLKSVPNANIHIPDHTIIEKIGSGGMSSVYLGRQISLQRKVAIKVLRKLVMEDQNLAERFVNEAKTIASLDHPHIITIYEAKQLPSGLTYFTMPYLNHGNFGDIICTNADHLIDLLCQICEGLAYAHDRGVIHRDLKPDNILFDQFGQLKIADFGIALSKDTKRKTKDEQILGSAHYMSPEQIQSRDINYLSDIYSLGCIIYEKLTGDHLYDANNDFAVLLAHINKAIPELPKALAKWQPILNKCLAKDPADRYQSALEVKEDLLAIKSPEPTKEKNKVNWQWPAWLKPVHAAAGSAALLALVLLWALWPESNQPVSTDLAESKPLNPPALANQDNPIPNTNQATEAIQAVTTQLEDQPANEEAVIDEPNTSDDLDIALEEVVVLDDANQPLDGEAPSIDMLLTQGNEALKKFRLTKPAGESAFDRFKAVLAIEPDHAAAKEGLNQIGRYYFNLVESKRKDGDHEKSMLYAQTMIDFINAENINKGLYSGSIEKIVAEATIAVDTAVKARRNNQQADQLLELTTVLTESSDAIQQLNAQYQTIPQLGQTVAQAGGMNMVFIPGSSPESDLMVAQHEITVSQYQAFAGEKASKEKCKHLGGKGFFKKYSWIKPPFNQTGKHPVICLNAQEVQAYAQWLSKQTGQTYRLPTAAEWQHLTQYATAKSCSGANLAGQETNVKDKITDQALACKDAHVYTAPVQSYGHKSNIHDLNGNVAEWVLNCPQAKGCQQFALAGSSWQKGKDANNNIAKIDAATRDTTIGFRLVRSY